MSRLQIEILVEFRKFTCTESITPYTVSASEKNKSEISSCLFEKCRKLKEKHNIENLMVELLLNIFHQIYSSKDWYSIFLSISCYKLLITPNLWGRFFENNLEWSAAAPLLKIWRPLFWIFVTKHVSVNFSIHLSSDFISLYFSIE